MSKEVNIYQSLSRELLQNVTTNEEREEYIKKFLHQRLPQSDINSIPNELKKSFLLRKHKSNVTKNKKAKSISFCATRKCMLLSLNNLMSTQNLKYADIDQLNKLWLGYMKELLGVNTFSEIKNKMNPLDTNYENFTKHIMRADYHGAIISVSESKCPTLIGIKGIVIVETKNIFRIISENNKIRSIPKDQCVFSIYLENVILNVEGKDMCVRPAERSVKKFKSTFKV